MVSDDVPSPAVLAGKQIEAISKKAEEILVLLKEIHAELKEYSRYYHDEKHQYDARPEQAIECQHRAARFAKVAIGSRIELLRPEHRATIYMQTLRDDVAKFQPMAAEQYRKARQLTGIED